MLLPGSTGTITLKNLRVYTQYLFRVRKGTVDGSWGAFTKYTSIWTPEGGKNMNGYDKKSVNWSVLRPSIFSLKIVRRRYEPREIH